MSDGAFAFRRGAALFAAEFFGRTEKHLLARGAHQVCKFAASKGVCQAEGFTLAFVEISFECLVNK
jgi:hypothetical protein